MHSKFLGLINRGLKSYNYIKKLNKKMEINCNIFKSLIIGSVRYRPDLTSYTGSSQLYFGICTDNTLHKITTH